MPTIGYNLVVRKGPLWRLTKSSAMEMLHCRAFFAGGVKEFREVKEISPPKLPKLPKFPKLPKNTPPTSLGIAKK